MASPPCELLRCLYEEQWDLVGGVCWRKGWVQDTGAWQTLPRGQANYAE